MRRRWPVMLQGVYQLPRIYTVCVSLRKNDVRCVFSPVDDGHCLAVCTVAVREDLVVDSDVFKALDDAEGCTREDGLDHAGRGNIAIDRNVRRGDG